MNDQNPIYKHKKTGGYYVVLFDALVQETLMPVVVYKCCKTGQRYIRPAGDFYDGRFELVA